MRIFLLMCLGMTLLAGCQMPASIRTPSLNMDKISPSPEDASAVSSTSLTTALPPSTITIRAVYYLSGDPLNPQIWRTPLTGGVSQQVTHIDPPGISDFDIDPAHGAISFITDHRLFILPFDNTTGPSDAVRVIFPEELDAAPQAPRWSPDGTNLAVGLGGIRIYQPETKTWTMFLPNLPDGTVYAPYAWAPDGLALLISIRQPAAGTLGILDMHTGVLETISQRPVCCQALWTSDSQSILVSNPYWRAAPTGLRLINRVNREERWLIPPQSMDGTYNLVGWPYLNQDGKLSLFYGNIPTPPETTLPLSMARTNPIDMNDPDSSSITLLRTGSLMINEVLWRNDGSQAVIVQPPPGKSDFPQAGPVILIPAGEGSAQPLAASGYNLRWGP